ncbi:MAG: hypothetical protein JJU15_06140 [Pararhodobacter sp.]|nr:hypothetical protein [Pararhodobacter sp.]
MRYVVLLATCTALGARVMPTPAPHPDPIVRPIPQPHPVPREPRRGERELCNAERWQYLVGRPLPQPFPARGNVRIYRSDMSVTMDYLPNRLNVEVDPDTDRIVTINCG